MSPNACTRELAVGQFHEPAIDRRQLFAFLGAIVSSENQDTLETYLSDVGLGDGSATPRARNWFGFRRSA